ncbi:MAG: type II secretion system protein GspD [Candidatus Dadabacteria bacterium RIFCSPHIGHO2_12_FULL_53_21]|nr:MAG: type II secretion system protein GspD [Candidatus Dadabacteria bacterium RIFCSPHIGHO2_12_FULL_53_21]
MRGLLINILILGFLLTLYVYVNTDHEKTTIKENTAQTTELENEESILQSQNEDPSYKVQEGDTLSQIAERFQVSVKQLKEINGLTSDVLSVGEYIDIPVQSDTGRLNIAGNDTYAPYGGPGDSETMTQSLGDQDPAYNQDASDQPTSDRQAEIEQRRQKLLEQKEQYRQQTPNPRRQNTRERPNFQKSPPKDKETGTQPPPETGEETGADEQKPEIIVTDGEIVNLQSEMDVQDLIQTISEITGQNFILDESVKGKKVTVIAPGGFKKENAMRLFETILSLNGFSVVKKEGTNIIVPKRDIKITSIPTEIGTELGESSDSFITRLIQLKNIQASEAANILKPLISREGDIVVYPATNTLIIVETVDNLNRILKIIENLDVETEIEFIKIHNADAAEVAAKLVEIFGGTASSKSSAPAQAQQSQRQSATRTRSLPGSENRSEAPAITSQSTTETSAVGFKVITDERTNSLIVISYPDDMKKIKAVIEILDVETAEPEEGIYVIRVLNADAESIVAVLASLFGGGGARTGLGADRNQRTSGFGSDSGLGSSTTGIGSNTSTSRQAIERGVGSSSAVVAETDELRVTSDPSTNSIIFIGSRRDYETIKEVIEELDVRRKQVFVEAAILEVSLDKIRSFGTNLSIGFTVNGDTLGFGGTILPGVPSLLGVAADPEASVNVLGSLSGLFLGVVGQEVDVDGSGPIPPIPSFTALFQALTSLTDVNVLSTPSIITTDNEPAEIIVADVIPFPTGSTVGDSGVTVQTIQREPVGIRLSIVPQISEGDFLNLNILTEVSAIRQAPVQGLNTAEFGIATTTRTADSSVVVKNGQTIVIGGLVQDRESVIQNRVPVLGNIPVLGNLFKFKQRESQKINLMILLTPRIVENEQDMQRILEERQRRNMLLQERGFNREDNN